ncbi:MAG: efflux RND transporter periplasmic adaptor subunit [Acidobacteria bacterium]|nr:efflux RND transporter periplasmic adaptor subunit [Bryobacteraceae bacterium CoA2 C42]MCA2963746.1 efflux RND transporter periplasmic adaptor subunit [Acidobacteriaceae bacterium]
MKRTLSLALLCALGLSAQETVPVVVQPLDRKLRLPAEILPYQAVDLHARVQGFVEKVEVDRGSVVRKGQLLIELSAPELKAQLAEVEAKAVAVESQRAEAEARLASQEAVLERLRQAAATAGAVAGIEVIQAQNAAEALRSQIASIQSQARATRASAAAIGELIGYLKVTAPFDGVVTARHVHPGALANGPLLRIEQVNRLRVVVAVPESEVATMIAGANVPFTIAGGLTGSGVITRIARSVDPKTRTMPVELEVANASGKLSPGMYAEATWPARRALPSILVPPTAVAVNTEKVFVIRSNQGRAEHVPVVKGAAAGELVEVFGALAAGDRVLRRASDEIRPGTPLK